jgi:glycosyltransferase involved in cell wall biosynthesis
VRVLYLVWDNPLASYGGIQSQIQQLLSGMGSTASVKVLPACNVRLLRGGTSDDYFPLQRIAESLGATLRGRCVTVVHSHNLHRPNGLGVAEKVIAVLREHSVPHVHTVHDFDANTTSDELLRTGRVLAQGRCVATSEFIQRGLQKYLHLQSDVIYPCFAANADADYRSPRNPIPVVVAPGRILPQKGLLAAVVVCGYLSMELGPIVLRMSSRKTAHNGGDSEFIAELLRSASAFPKLSVSFFEGGKVVPDLYSGAHLTLCLPEALEGFALGPLESLLCGVPVVAVVNGGPGFMASDFAPGQFVTETGYHQGVQVFIDGGSYAFDNFVNGVPYEDWINGLHAPGGVTPFPFTW